ncbi:MAG TPA: linear amide C-N hydrolase [Planctomicrobium sp.]|nr:linear amide C-N hydrolase [Planctomicrobium sp.]
MRRYITTGILGLALSMSPTHQSDACSRVLYQTGSGGYIVGRTMDWMEDTQTDLWAYPKGIDKDGGTGKNTIKWTSKYGSVTASLYNAATVDGINEAGLVGNVLYLAESDYGSDSKTHLPGISVGAWLQYVLDNYATVDEAVKALKEEPFHVVAPTLPNGRAATGHVAISDPTGDSAIFEYIDGKLVIHHGPQFKVMTNSPTYDKQLAITGYWDEIGGQTMLPGTNRAADRFVRVSYYLGAVPKYEDARTAAAAVFSIIRNASVPLGITDPEKPNIATTLWRTVADSKERRYYYESTTSPNIFWVDIAKLNLAEGAKPSRLNLKGNPILAGEVSEKFEEAVPFKWLSH